MPKFKLQDGLFYDTRTGTAQSFDATGSQEDCYAVLIQSGHCGKGYYIPQIRAIKADSAELAIAIAKNSSRVKTNRKNSILAVCKISQKERAAIDYINGCDPYRNTTTNTDALPYVQARRIVMQEAVDFENTGEYGKVPLDAVRTAEKYPEKYVLQRHLAPSFYGDKLIFPKNINLRNILDDFFYYGTIEHGFNHGKVPAIAFYYQLYGENNKLGIRYKNGRISYKYKNEVKYVKINPEIQPYLEEAKKKFKEEARIREEEEKARQEREKARPIEIKSSTERFNARYKKYLEMKSRDTKLPGDQ